MVRVYYQMAKSSRAIDALIGVVILLILVSYLAPTALKGLFNTTAFTGVPTWVPTVLGIMGAVAFIYLIWRAVED